MLVCSVIKKSVLVNGLKVLGRHASWIKNNSDTRFHEKSHIDNGGIAETTKYIFGNLSDPKNAKTEALSAGEPRFKDNVLEYFNQAALKTQIP